MKPVIIKNYLKNPFKYTTLALNRRRLLCWLPDKLFLPIYYRAFTGKHLHLKAPVTFNEKLQWLKLYDRNPEYSRMVDKYEAKKYVAGIIGEEHIIPTLGVWDRFDDIDFDKLPDQFVLKCTHDSGGLVICRDKSTFDKSAAREKIVRCLGRNYYWGSREWPYKNVPPRIIAEQYMEDGNEGDLKDYKIFCFHGVPKIIQLDYDRFRGHKRNMYSVDWERLPVDYIYFGSDSFEFQRPGALEEMLCYAKELSKEIPFVRVDFYYAEERVFFGEMTFFPESGFGRFSPGKWDGIIGSWISLPDTDNQ